MGNLTNEQFFSKLAELFAARKGQDHGAIYLTQKRLTYGEEAPAPSEADPLADLNPSKPLPVLIRATNGKSKKERAKKLKLSTVVDPNALDAFYGRYAEVCKAGMSSLKPRDRSKKKAKAKKRKGGAGATAGAT